MLNIGISQWCLDIQGPKSIVRAKNLGMSTIQIQCYLPNNKYYIGRPENIIAYNLLKVKTASSLSALVLSILPAIDNERFRWKIIKDSINGAFQVGIRTLIIPSFNKSEIKSDRDMDQFANLVNKMFDKASRNNFDMKIASENTLSAKKNIELVKRVDNPNFEIFIDTLNPILLGYSAEEYINTLWEYKCDQIHVKDGSNGLSDNERLNNGIGNVRGSLNQIFSKRFSGRIILENDYSINTESRIEYDINQIKKAYKLCQKQFK